MMATSLKQAVHKNLECPVCLSFFKEPKNLACSHTFCKGCLETLLESHGNKDVLLCPTCRMETSVPGGDVGRLQSNITVRSLVEDVKTQAKVCSRGNQEDQSLEKKWSKCKKHPNYDEECFCLNCNKYVCCKCAILEHVNYAHTILEAGAHETEQKNNVDKLASKADAKIRDVDKYVSSVVDQRQKVHNLQEQRKDEIDETFEEFVQILKQRKTVLKNEVEHGQLGKLKTSLGDMEESSRKQIDQIKKALDLVKNGLHFPLQTKALTSHKAKCQQLEELLSRIGPDTELPRRTAEEGERISFTSQGSDEFKLGQLQYTPTISATRLHDSIACQSVAGQARKLFGLATAVPPCELFRQGPGPDSELFRPAAGPAHHLFDSAQPASSFGGAAQPTSYYPGAAKPTSSFGGAAQPTSSFGGAAQPTSSFGGAAQPTEYFGGAILPVVSSSEWVPYVRNTSLHRESFPPYRNTLKDKLEFW